MLRLLCGMGAMRKGMSGVSNRGLTTGFFFLGAAEMEHAINNAQHTNTNRLRNMGAKNKASPEGLASHLNVLKPALCP